MMKLIYGDKGASASQYGMVASLSLLAAIVGFQTVGITVAAAVQSAALSVSLTM